MWGRLVPGIGPAASAFATSVYEHSTLGLREVEQWRRTTVLDERARLAAEYAERYTVDHHGLDDGFWTRMRAHYSDREIAELTMCPGSWIAFGRLDHVLGLDAVCSVPEHLAQR